MLKSEIHLPNTYLYFTYGANMWSFRMRMVNPSVKFVSIARLDNYRLDFNRYTKFWGGPMATSVPTANAHIWGVIWSVNNDDKHLIDHDKGVDIKKYYIKYVEVLTPYMGSVKCRAYMQKVIPLPRGDNDEIPVERWPSKIYQDILILGAIEHNLPECYILDIMKLKHNGEEGCFKMVCLLIRYATEKPCECSLPVRKPKSCLKLDLREHRKKLEEKSNKN